MKILLLGGIGEALALARTLHGAGHELIYSVAGLGRRPELPCRVRVGGFGGAAALADFLRSERIELLLDITHPYAAQISHAAAEAAGLARLPLWAYRRPPWQPKAGDDWRPVPDWPAARTALAGFRRPFLALGASALKQLESIPEGQQWLLRILPGPAAPARAGLTVVNELGPFDYEHELALMRTHEVDVLVCKNSGGAAVAAKLEAARTLRLPVLMIERPPLPAPAREFDRIEALALAVAERATAMVSP